MQHFHRLLVVCVILGLITKYALAEEVSSIPKTLTEPELTAGTITLFNGLDTFGWETSGDATWTVKDHAIHCAGEKPGFLITKTDFADYTLTLEFRSTATTNSGVFVHCSNPPTDPKSDCYEINIATPAVSPFPTGSIVQRAKRTGDYADSNDWQRLVIVCDGAEVRVSIGSLTTEPTLLCRWKDEQPLRRGRIALQSNTGPISFRNIKLTPKLADKLPLAPNLSGWKVFPGKMAEYSVNPTGELVVKNGPGMLEYTAKEYGDFILQWQVKTNAVGLNSGVFFRQIAGEFTLGYECQIQNAFKSGDRLQPVDCGTGGFYRRQNARWVLGNDQAWTAMTLVVHGPHMTTWVNGIQVSDWTDDRKPDDNPRKGLRLKPGTLSIQGHDPTTDILFRDLRASELPERR